MAESRRATLMGAIPLQGKDQYQKIISGTPTSFQHKMKPSPSLSKGEYLRWLRKKLKQSFKGKNWTAEDEAAS